MKKTLSIFIALVMMLSLAVLGISAAAGDVAAGYTPAVGSVAITSLSEITDPAGCYHLEGDITVSETYTAEFRGVLDGCGYTVTLSAPMFADLNGTVRNMVLEGSITANNQSAAAVAVESTAGMTAQNITSNVDITVTGDVADLWAAAIVCKAHSITTPSYFNNIVNNGDISAVSTANEKARAAGIADIVEMGEFVDCVNNGKIYSSATVSALSAGICARPALNPSGVGCYVKFHHCVNNGDVVADGRSADAGGIAGYAGHKGNDGVVYEFYRCVNTGDVTAVYRSAGIVAYVYGGTEQYADVYNCINTGTVTFGGNTETNGDAADAYGSPFIAYINSTKTKIANVIDAGSLVCIDEGNEKIALVTCSSAKYVLDQFANVYITDAANKFDYLVYSTKGSNVPMTGAESVIFDTTLDFIKSDDFISATTGFIKAEGLPVVSSGDSWNGNNYVIYVPVHVCGNLTYFEATEMTCGKAGNIAYYTCGCGKYYADAEATTEIKKQSIEIPIAKDHTWGETTYKWYYNGSSGVPIDCVASRVCTVCESMQKAYVSSMSTITVETGNCQRPGKEYKVAEFSVDWATNQNSEVYEYTSMNHTGASVFTIKDETYHTRTYLCCGTVKDYKHIMNSGECKNCGYIEGAAQYTVTYIVDGKVYFTQKVCYQGRVSRPAAPEKDGALFNDWYTEENGKGQSLSSTYNFESDMTFYAYYQSEVTVMFRVVQLDGSSGFIHYRIDDHKYGTACEEPDSSKYARGVPAGYYVEGWYTDKNFTTAFDFSAPITVKKTNIYGKLAELKGWCRIDGEWYYYNEDGSKATGIVRLPYPKVEINGVTYAPNAEDLQYVLDHPEKYYSDAETALFIFDEDGKFVADTGFVTYEGATRYAADGMIGWHPGLVEIDGEYYYFLGDSNGCGNIMMTGDVYVTRNTTDLEVYYGGIYTFAEDGKLCRYEGLTKIGDKLYYYDGYCRSKTVGAVEVEPGKYIYVRTTNCEVIVGRSYWVTATGSSNLVKGAYTFDENGYITNPVVKNTEATDGIFDGYYYENGEIAYGKGAVEIDGDIYFVTASGKIAVGEYWVTQSSEILPAGKYTFGEDGKLVK